MNLTYFQVFFFIGLIYFSFFSEGSIKRKYNWAFITFALLLFISFKIGFLFYNRPLNEDEAINLSEVLGILKFDPVLWRSIDFFTLGPIQVLSFGIPSVLGFEIDFASPRIVWLIYSILIFILLILAFTNFFNKKIASLSSLYLIIFFSVGPTMEFNHFYNETTSIFLLSLGFYLLSLSYCFGYQKNQYLQAIFYFSMGLVPYSKLQAVPTALILVFFSFYLYFYKTEKFSFKKILTFSFWGLLPTMLLLGYLAFYGQINNFIQFYLVSNLSYGNSATLLQKFYFSFIGRASTSLAIGYYYKYIFGITVFLNTCRIIYNRKITELDILFLLISFSTIYAISKPGMAYGHYYSYLIIPFIFSIALLINGIQMNLMKYAKYVYCVLMCLLFYVFINAWYLMVPDNLNAKKNDFKYPPIYQSELSKRLISIGNMSQKTPKMVVFGWRPRLHVETGFYQAVHQNVPERLFGNQTQDATNFSENMYFADLVRNRPEFFLIENNTQESYYDFTISAMPKLKNIYSYFKENYVYVESLEDYDIFLRKDLENWIEESDL